MHYINENLWYYKRSDVVSPRLKAGYHLISYYMRNPKLLILFCTLMFSFITTICLQGIKNCGLLDVLGHFNKVLGFDYRFLVKPMN